MIELRRRSWTTGIGMATALHLVLAAVWLWRPPAEGTTATGAGGMQVGLASAGAPEGAAGSAAGESAEAARPETAEVPTPETASVQSPDAATDPDTPLAAKEVEITEATAARPVLTRQTEVTEARASEAVEAAVVSAVAQSVAPLVDTPPRVEVVAEPAASPETSIEPVEAHPVEKPEVVEAGPVEPAAARPDISEVEQPDPVAEAEPITAAPVELPLIEAETAEPAEQQTIGVEAVDALPTEPKHAEVAANPPPAPPPRPARLKEDRPRPSVPVPAANLPQKAAADASIADTRSAKADRGENRPVAARQPGEGRQADRPGAQGGSGSKAGQRSGDGPGQRTGGGSPGERADYLAQLQLWLERHKKYPRKAQRRRQEGTAKLFFVMSRDGAVLDYRIEESSGHRLLDREVEAMIRRAQPLPAMPPDLVGEQLELVVPVVFSMR